MTRRLWKIAVALTVLAGTLVVGVLLFLWNEHHSGERELQSTKDRLAAEGVMEPLDKLAPAENQAAMENGQKLVEASRPLKELSKSFPLVVNGPRTMKIIAPGIASPAARQPALEIDGSREPPVPWETFREQLAEAAAVFSETRRILETPVALKYDHQSPLPQLDLGELQKLAAWLRSRAVLELHDNDPASAIRSMEDCQKIAALMGTPRSLISHVLELGLWSFSLSGTVWEILQSPSLTENDLLRLQKILSRPSFLSDTLRAMQIELHRVSDIYRLAGESHSSAQTWAFLSDPPGLLGKRPFIEVRNLLWPYAWSSADMARILEFWEPSIRLAKKLEQHRNWAEIRPRIPKDKTTPAFDHWRFPFAAEFALNAIVRSMLLSGVRTETRRQLALAAVGLARYRTAFGRYPDTLTELTPKFLPEIPYDVFNGQPLKYRVLPGNEFLLYSVNENGTDDGGDASTPDGKTSNFSRQNDLIWPRAASGTQ